MKAKIYFLDFFVHLRGDGIKKILPIFKLLFYVNFSPYFGIFFKFMVMWVGFGEELDIKKKVLQMVIKTILENKTRRHLSSVYGERAKLLVKTGRNSRNLMKQNIYFFDSSTPTII